MRDPFEKKFAEAKPVHPHHWLWEPLESDSGFELKPMFGGKSLYLDGDLMLYFAAKKEPWHGLLVCTDRVHHAALQKTFPDLAPHPLLPKWLYLPDASDSFERAATRLVALARQRDPRIGVAPKPRNKAKSSVGCFFCFSRNRSIWSQHPGGKPCSRSVLARRREYWAES